MLKRIYLIAIAALLSTCCCQKEDYGWVKTGIDRAHHQLMMTAARIDGTDMLPR